MKLNITKLQSKTLPRFGKRLVFLMGLALSLAIFTACGNSSKSQGEIGGQKPSNENSPVKEEPKSFFSVEKVTGDYSYEVPKYDFSKIDGADCNWLNMYDNSDLRSQIKLSDLSCVKALVEKYKINLNKESVDSFGDKDDLPLELSLESSSLFFGRKKPGGPAALPMLLISLGANPEALGRKGKSALELALEIEYPEYKDVVHSIIEIPGINLNRVGKSGTPLELAIQQEQQAIVRHLLNKGVDVNLSSKNKNSPLLMALDKKLNFSATLLINKGAHVDDADYYGNSPLHLAARLKDNSLVALILSKGANASARNQSGASALHVAAENQSLDVAQELIRAGTNVNVQNQDGKTALHLAVKSGQMELVTTLLAANANVNLTDYFGKSPIFYALENGHDNISLALLVKNAETDIRDQLGNTPAHFVKSLAMLQSLVKFGAPIDKTNNAGDTLLSLEVPNDNLEMIEYLVSQGASLNWRSSYRYTLLHVAAKAGALRAAQFLISKNANLNSANKFGQTPIFVADHTGMIQLLAKNGADMNHQNAEGDNTLYERIQPSTSVDTVRTLLTLGVKPMSGPNKSSLNRLMAGLILQESDINNMLQLTDLLIEHGDNPMLTNEMGNNSLHTLLSNRRLAFYEAAPLVQKLLENTPALKTSTNILGTTPGAYLTELKESLTKNKDQEIYRARNNAERIEAITLKYDGFFRKISNIEAVLN